MLGVVTAQLFRLQRQIMPDAGIGYFLLGVPLAVTCIICAVLLVLLGGYRFWRQQQALVRGKIYAGGWEVKLIVITGFMVNVWQCVCAICLIVGYRY